MPQLIDCPSGHRLKVPSKHAGHRIRCPVCNESVAVPPLQPPSTIEQRPQLDGDSDPALIAVGSLDAASVTSAIPPRPEPGSSPDPVLDNSLPPREARRDLPAHSPAAEQFSVHLAETAREPTQYVDVAVGLAHDAPLVDVTGGQTLAQPFESRSELSSRFAAEQHRTVRLLGFAAIGVAVVFAVPSISDQLASLSGKSQHASEPWTYLLLLLALVQSSVAVYAMRLPDWSTAWCVAVVVTANAAIHALVLAMTNFAKQDHDLLKRLGLLDEKYHGTAGAWCFLVICVTLGLAYWLGSFSLRWHQLERHMRELRSGELGP